MAVPGVPFAGRLRWTWLPRDVNGGILVRAIAIPLIRSYHVRAGLTRAFAGRSGPRSPRRPSS